MTDAEFHLWVESTVANTLRATCVDFAELTCNLPGIYPQDVLRALHALISKRPMEFDRALATLAASAGQERAVSISASALLGLPPPHPLDFEWRFGSGAIEALANATTTVTPHGQAVAMVGTPTFAASAAPSRRPSPIDYFGLDAEVLRTLGVNRLREIRSIDLLSRSHPEASYATVVMDPPWYDEHLIRFIYFAAQSLAPGGHLLIAMPACGTRPGIDAENDVTLQWAERLGLRLEDVAKGALPYETPPFERSALRAAGIVNVAAEWRRGDLWTLQRIKTCSVDWPGDIRRALWREFKFGPVRIRVDSCAESTGADPSMRSIVAGDVLSSVSRRDPRRAAARIWTTCNRVFACEAPAKFASMVEAWNNGRELQECSNDFERFAHERLLTIIARERLELAWPDQEVFDCGTGNCAS